MSIPERIKESILRSLPLIPSEARELAKALVTPKALAEIAATLIIWGASQLIGIGEVADLVLLVVGYVMLGKTALAASKELLAYGEALTEAETSADLDIAAQHFARAVTLIGVTAVTAILLRRAGRAGSAEGAATKSEAAAATESTAAKAADETLYARAARTLDIKLIKRLVIDAWKQPRKWPVKVFKIKPGQRIGDAVEVGGYFTTEQSVAGATLRELERRLGFKPGYLGDSAAIVKLERLPKEAEFDLRFYNNIHGGGIEPPNPCYPLGPGYPQWQLFGKIPAHIVKIISK
jgi:hypothetical protein